jgi:transposase
MYAALDLHKMYSEAVVVDQSGTVLDEERIDNDIGNLERFSNSLPQGTDVVIESSSTWYWVYSILQKRHNVVLANAAKTKAIASAKVKTDRLDTLTLANLLRGGYIAESYIPPKKVMELRELVRYRANLVRIRTNLKNRIHAYLLMNNVKIETGSKPFTREFVSELKKIDEPRVQGYLRLIESVNVEIHEASKQISNEASSNEDAKLLMTIPGISFYSALLIASEIGDVSRFSDSYHLVSYAGLAPSTYSSGGKTSHGNITKTGSPYLRWTLNQCARVNIREEPEGNLAKFYCKLRAKKGDGKAITAASAKLLKIIYWVLKEKREYYG